VRADEKLMPVFLDKFNKVSKTPYKTVTWTGVDRNGNPIYHTNVVMAVLKNHVVLCTDSIRDKKERDHVIQEISDPK
jgi:hypothetical protein